MLRCLSCSNNALYGRKKSLPLPTTDTRKYEDRELRRLQRDGERGMLGGGVAVVAALHSMTKGGIELPGITAVEHPLQRSHVRELILRKSDYVSRVQNHANLLTEF